MSDIGSSPKAGSWDLAGGGQAASAAMGPSSPVLSQAEAHTLKHLLMPVLLPQKYLCTENI